MTKRLSKKKRNKKKQKEKHQEAEQQEEEEQQGEPQQEVMVEAEKLLEEEPEKVTKQRQPVDVPSSSSSKRKLSFATNLESKKGKIDTPPTSDTLIDIRKMSTRQLKQLTKRKQDMVLTSVKNILYNFAPDVDIDEEPIIDQL